MTAVTTCYFNIITDYTQVPIPVTETMADNEMTSDAVDMEYLTVVLFYAYADHCQHSTPPVY